MNRRPRNNTEYNEPSVECTALTRFGDRCKNKCLTLFPYCWIHLKSIDKLQVKKSQIQGGGKGLYYVGKKPFAKDKRIAYYSTKEITHQTNDDSLYELQISKNRFMNADSKLTHVGRYINDTHNTNFKKNVRYGNSYNTSKVNDREAIPIITTRVIQPNSELYVTYGNQYWRNV